MKKRLIMGISSVIFFLTTGYSDLNFSVVSVLGSPKVRAKGKLIGETIVYGSILSEGDRVKLKKGDRLSLEDSKGNTLNVVGPAYYRLPLIVGPSGNFNQISMFKGKVDFKKIKVNTDNSFIVRAPTAVAGVRSVPGSIDDNGNFIPLSNKNTRRNKDDQ